MAFDLNAANDILRAAYAPAITERMFADSPLLQWLDGPSRGSRQGVDGHTFIHVEGQPPGEWEDLGRPTQPMVPKDFTIPLEVGKNAGTYEGIERSTYPWWQSQQAQQGNALNQSGFAYQQLEYRGIPITYDRNVPTGAMYLTNSTTTAGNDWVQILSGMAAAP